MAPRPPSTPEQQQPERDQGKVEWSMESLRAAEEHFKSFFDEIGEHIIEREDLIAQLQLALLAREHVLVIGHSGTSKSTIARMLFERLVDSKTGRTSFFDKPVNVETRTGEVAGPLLPKSDPATGEMDWTRKIERGIAPCRYAFIDEIFDAPPAVLRGALLQALNERTVDKDGRAEPIELRSAIAASNKKLEEAAMLAEKAATNLDAIFDRFAFIFWTCQRTFRGGSDPQMVKKDAERGVRVGDSRGSRLTVQPLTFDELDLLRETVLRVREKMTADGWALTLVAKLYNEYHSRIGDREVDIRKRTKIYSGRSMTKLVNLLSAIAVARHIRHPETPLAVIPPDFKELRLALMTRGPVSMPGAGSVDNKHDTEMLYKLGIENEVFDEAYREVIDKWVDDNVEKPIPENLTPISESIESVQATADNPSPTEEDLQRALNTYTSIVAICEKLPLSSRGGAKGEKIYLKAVVAYVNLLRRAVTMGCSRKYNVRNLFVHMLQVHGSSIGALAVPPELAEAVDRFDAALADEYRQEATRPHSVEEMVGLMGAIVADARGGALRKDVVDSLCGVVRFACLNGVLVSSPNMPCRQYSDVSIVKGELEALAGLSASLTPTEAFALCKKVLEYMRDALTAVKDNFSAKIADASERERIADVLDELKGLYKSEGLEDDSSIEFRMSGDGIPADFLNERQAAMGTQFGSAVVNAAIEANHVKWTCSKTENREFDADQVRAEYGEFLAGKVAADDEAFSKLPLIADILSKATAVFEKYIGKDWKEEYGEIIMLDVLRVCREMLQNRADGALECPFEIPGVRLKPGKISFAYVNKAVQDKVALLRADDSAPTEFMVSKGLADTPANLATVRSLLTGGTGRTSIPVETVQTVEEEITTGDIVEFERRKEVAAREVLKHEIKTLIEAVESMYAEQLAREQQGQLATPISVGGVAVTPKLFMDKWDLAARSAPTTVGPAAKRFKHLQIPSPQTLSSIPALEADMKALVSGMHMDSTRGLRDVLLVPLAGVIDFCRNNGAGGVLNSASVEVAAKLQEWLEGKRAAITAIGNLTKIPSTEGFTRKRKVLKEARVQCSQVTVPTADDLAAISEAAVVFSVDNTIADGFLKMGKRSSLEYVSSEVDVCEAYVLAVQALEIPEEHGFRFGDLNTMTLDNQGEVVKKVHNFFDTVKAVFEKAKSDLTNVTARQAELELTQADVDGLKARLDASKASFDSLERAFKDRMVSLV